ncbi:hypothetical protein CDAR_368741 [Caerostris darwini]|uniref:Uncharacterized protein n=1 Tax=Caerostris darwini TaxID=1538125 RepID=A0AAV4X1H0_9ARAC|nr:hypothetical protein CDAR_368741 [Caerostris darwini]
MPKPGQKPGVKNQVNNKKNKKTHLFQTYPQVSTRTQPTAFTSRNVQPTVAFSEILRQGNEAKSIGPALQPIMVREPLPAATTNSSAPVSTSSECSLTEIFQCLMDLTNQYPTHSQIILRAFGLAKDKVRSSSNRFDMTHHLFEAYTNVLSQSELLTA